ncbi:hypothetical protein CVT24_000782 [Panaeolus cyanescens]|uniref:RING-type domain-containing protein n=1 Tax=Panaeolus cyanescens TaxID=181874 RepID=A0A409YCM2_9AGAR|nr:hypothetical protein CVT24_000782 [Panaeolus cyanescens]
MAAQPGSGEDNPAAVPPAVKDKKATEPLFGPNIGTISGGPAWTFSNEKKVVSDELTPEIVNGWIEKSKQASQPTTTLQALVNLKRPTLRLSPLSSHSDDPASSEEQHHHALEFEYDCDAPKCGIYVNVHLPKTHPDAPTTSHSQLAKLLVFETVVDGGFGNHLKLEEGAVLELGRFEHNPSAVNATPSSSLANNLEKLNLESDTPPVSDGASATNSNTNSGANNGTAGTDRSRRRFTNFHFRKRSHNRSVAGPALAVVDADPAQAHASEQATAGGAKTKDGKEEEEGVKVTIRLVALDEQGTELVSPNEQITYLHIVRFGAAQPSGEKPDAAVEDTRPWVVRVVKREATIGPHTFHLHEIYGLTSSSSSSHAAASPEQHTYPPTEDAKPGVIVQTADDDEPQSECLLCLSSPREVVLLPCRHLVACRECALNMVEFGAGGTISQVVEPVGVDATGDGAAPTGTPGTVVAGLPSPAPPANPRRRRKAKGWFCPVCRQPYTSMLRLTTSHPPVAEAKDDGSGTEDEGMQETEHAGIIGTLPVVSPLAPAAATLNGNDTTQVRGGGLLGGALRPGFLRGLSLSRATSSGSIQSHAPAAPATAHVAGSADVERQAGLGRSGA